MKKYFNRKSKFESPTTLKRNNKDLKQSQIEINLEDLFADPRLILDYNPNV